MILDGVMPKFIVITLIIMAICPIVTSAVMTQYSFVKDLTISPISVNGPEITVSVTCKVYFTDKAWSTFYYKDGSFAYMSKWWDQHEGETFTFMGHSAKLQKIDFTLVQHTAQYDQITAVVKAHFIN